MPGGTGMIVLSGGSLTAGFFVNGGAANAGSFNNGTASAIYSQTGGTAFVGPITGTGSMTVSGGRMNANSIRQSSLTVSGGSVNIAANGTAAGTSVVKSLSVSGTGKLDLANNALIVDYTGGTPPTGVRAALASGYASGNWNGNGITSSSAAAATHSPHPTALGYADASALGIGSFGGQTFGSAVVIGYTYSGDANLDGTVNTADFNRLATNFNGTNKEWISGDFNYDGKANALDYNAIATNFGQVIAAPALGTLVPEPIAASALAAIALLATRRSRRTRR
jgi:hypothetical protein